MNKKLLANSAELISAILVETKQDLEESMAELTGE
jgi:hypothetical protein